MSAASGEPSQQQLPSHTGDDNQPTVYNHHSEDEHVEIDRVRGRSTSLSYPIRHNERDQRKTSFSLPINRIEALTRIFAHPLYPRQHPNDTISQLLEVGVPVGIVQNVLVLQEKEQVQKIPALMRLPVELIAIILSFVVDDTLPLQPTNVQDPYDDRCPIELPATAALGISSLRLLTIEAIFKHSTVQFTLAAELDRFLDWQQHGWLPRYALLHGVSSNLGGLRSIEFDTRELHILSRTMFMRRWHLGLSTLFGFAAANPNLQHLRLVVDSSCLNQFGWRSAMPRRELREKLMKETRLKRVVLINRVSGTVAALQAVEDLVTWFERMFALWNRQGDITFQHEAPGLWQRMMGMIGPWNRDYIVEQMRALLEYLPESAQS